MSYLLAYLCQQFHSTDRRVFRESLNLKKYKTYYYDDYSQKTTFQGTTRVGEAFRHTSSVC